MTQEKAAVSLEEVIHAIEMILDSVQHYEWAEFCMDGEPEFHLYREILKVRDWLWMIPRVRPDSNEERILTNKEGE